LRVRHRAVLGQAQAQGLAVLDDLVELAKGLGMIGMGGQGQADRGDRLEALVVAARERRQEDLRRSGSRSVSSRGSATSQASALRPSSKSR
jgi:hypothetical protein